MSNDYINKPSHYNQGNIEVIEILRDQLTNEEFKGFCKGNTLKYFLRYEKKGGVQDLEKSEYYLKELKKLLKK